MKTYLIVLKWHYLGKPISIYRNGKKLDPAHTYIMTEKTISKLDGYFAACFENSYKDRARQTKIAQSEDYTMQFIEIADDDVISVNKG